MSPDVFDDALLDDERALRLFDDRLRRLAESGARVRVAAEAAAPGLANLPSQQRPRAIVAAGADARLLRAVLEPWCPVPFVAWPGPSLPLAGPARSTWWWSWRPAVATREPLRR